MRHTDLIPLLALLQAEGLGDVTAKKLLAAFGDATSVFSADARRISEVSGNRKLAERLKDPSLFKKAQSEADYIGSVGHKVWHYLDDDYPMRLKHCPDGPVLLFGSGEIDLSNQRMISIVGTRQLTPHGLETCQRLIAELAPLNPVIVSGMAYGTDIAAHLAAADNGLQTIGVVAHGLDILYPPSHKKHVSRMKQNGGLISEFTSGTAPLPQNFVRRNRIVAGLSEAIIVIESAEKGGSLITAHMATGYNREVFAVPGRPGDKMSQGCLHLIKSQQAHLLTSAADLVYILNWQFERTRPVQKQLFISLNPEEKTVHDYLSRQGRQLLDVIAMDCELPVFKLSPMLLSMELKGAIRPLPGKWFEAI